MILRHRFISRAVSHHDKFINWNLLQSIWTTKLTKQLSHPSISNFHNKNVYNISSKNQNCFEKQSKLYWENFKSSSKNNDHRNLEHFMTSSSISMSTRGYHSFPLKILAKYPASLESLNIPKRYFYTQQFRANKEKTKEDILTENEGSKNVLSTGEIIERENIWTIPNLLCVSRIVLSPYLCYCVLSSHYSFALGLFILAGFTDLIDGMIARAFPSQASRIGSFLDPLADKILVSSLFLTLTYVGVIPFLLTGIIVYRDVVIIAGASYVRYRSLPPPITISRYFDATHATAQLAPTFFSKVNTAIQLGLITSSLAAPIFSFTDHPLFHAYWFLTAMTTMSSGIGYIFSKDTFKILKDIKNTKTNLTDV